MKIVRAVGGGSAITEGQAAVSVEVIPRGSQYDQTTEPQSPIMEAIMNPADPSSSSRDEKPNRAAIDYIQQRRSQINTQCLSGIEGLVRHGDILQKELEAQSLADMLLKGLKPENSAHHGQILKTSQLIYQDENATRRTLSQAFDKSLRSFETQSRNSLLSSLTGKEPPFLQAAKEAMKHTRDTHHAMLMTHIMHRNPAYQNLYPKAQELFGQLKREHNATDTDYTHNEGRQLAPREESYSRERLVSYNDQPNVEHYDTRESLALSENHLEKLKLIRDSIKSTEGQDTQDSMTILNAAGDDLDRAGSRHKKAMSYMMKSPEERADILNKQKAEVTHLVDAFSQLERSFGNITSQISELCQKRPTHGSALYDELEHVGRDASLIQDDCKDQSRAAQDHYRDLDSKQSIDVDDITNEFKDRLINLYTRLSGLVDHLEDMGVVQPQQITPSETLPSYSSYWAGIAPPPTPAQPAEQASGSSMALR